MTPFFILVSHSFMVDIFEKTFIIGPESIDVLGHVNNREYLRFMEIVALEHADLLGWGTQACLKRGEAWVAREHWAEFLRPTFLGDELTAYTWVQAHHASRSLRRYAIKRDKKVVFVGATEWAYIDMKTGRALDIPQDIGLAFPIVDADDSRLAELGISRPVRFTPEWVA